MGGEINNMILGGWIQETIRQFQYEGRGEDKLVAVATVFFLKGNVRLLHGMEYGYVYIVQCFSSYIFSPPPGRHPGDTFWVSLLTFMVIPNYRICS